MKTTLLKQNSCSSKGFCFARAGEAEDIYIRSNLSNAWNSDRVLVKLTKEAAAGRRRVELILERSIITRAGAADLRRASGCPFRRPTTV